jgi:hopanoid-associated phosphorylase
LAFEARIAHGAGVAVLCHQGVDLGAALVNAIESGASGIISFGIAGGLAPSLNAGDWVIARTVRSGDDIIATDRAWSRHLAEALPGAIEADLVGINVLMLDPLERDAFFRKIGGIAVDMESHIAAKIAVAHGIPFAACRVIANAAHRKLPAAAAVGVRRNGKADVRAVLRSLRRKPRQLPDLVRLAFDTHVARRALLAGRQRLGVGLCCPYPYANRPVLA